MHLMAAHSNISITHIPGINGSSIIEKAKPFRTKVTLNELGSWRAHANAWRRVMDAPYETALILEDDLDWDVNINDIMSLVSEHLPKSSPTDPWGHSSWDVLWLGACLNSPNPDLANEDVRYDDRWAPSRDNMRDYDKKYFDGLAQGGPYMDSGERVIQRAYKPVCTMAYAITKYAARKMLYNIGYRGLDGPVDLAMCWMHEKGQLKGWTVWPPLFMPWRVGGLHDSDIQSFSNGEDKGNEGGNSINLRDSIRKAMTKEYTSPAV